MRIEVNSQPVTDMLDAVRRRVSDLTPLMRELAGDLEAAVQENFEDEGPGWKELSPATIKQRARKGYWPGKILNRRGAAGLAGSFTTDYDNDSAAVGTNVPYARIQNDGGEIERGARSDLYARNRKKDGRYAKGTKGGIAGGAGKQRYGDSKTRIPARPFMVLRPHHVDRLVLTGREFLRRVVAGMQ